MLDIIMKMQEKYVLPSTLLDQLLTLHLFILRDQIQNDTRQSLNHALPASHCIRKARVSGYSIGILESYLSRHPEYSKTPGIASDILSDLSEIVDEHIRKFDEKFPAKF